MKIIFCSCSDSCWSCSDSVGEFATNLEDFGSSLIIGAERLFLRLKKGHGLHEQRHEHESEHGHEHESKHGHEHESEHEQHDWNDI